MRKVENFFKRGIGLPNDCSELSGEGPIHLAGCHCTDYSAGLEEMDVEEEEEEEEDVGDLREKLVEKKKKNGVESASK